MFTIYFNYHHFYITKLSFFLLFTAKYASKLIYIFLICLLHSFLYSLLLIIYSVIIKFFARGIHFSRCFNTIQQIPNLNLYKRVCSKNYFFIFIEIVLKWEMGFCAKCHSDISVSCIKCHSDSWELLKMCCTISSWTKFYCTM